MVLSKKKCRENGGYYISWCRLIQLLTAILILIPPLSRPFQCCFPVVFKSRNSWYKCAHHLTSKLFITLFASQLVQVLNFNSLPQRLNKFKTQGGALPLMAYMGKLCQKGVPFSRFRYMIGQGFYAFYYMKGQGNLPFRYLKGPVIKIC